MIEIDRAVTIQAEQPTGRIDKAFALLWLLSTALNGYFYAQANLELDISNVSTPIRNLANLGSDSDAMPYARAIAGVYSTGNLLLMAIVLIRNTYVQIKIEKEVYNQLTIANDLSHPPFDFNSSTKKIIGLTAIALAAGIPMAASDFREFSNEMNSPADIIANSLQFIGMYILYTIIHILPADIIYDSRRLFDLTKTLTPLFWPFYACCYGINTLRQRYKGIQPSTSPQLKFYQVGFYQWLKSIKTNETTKPLDYALRAIASIGALWATLGNSGYPMAAVDLAWNALDATTVPAYLARITLTYCLAVGPAFIVSTLIFEKTYHLIFSLGKQLLNLAKCQNNLPLMMRLFPLTYGLFLATIPVTSLLSFGAALRVILKNFSWVSNPALKVALEWMAVGKGFFFVKCNLYAFDWILALLCRNGYIGSAQEQEQAKADYIEKIQSALLSSLSPWNVQAIASRMDEHTLNTTSNTTPQQRDTICTQKRHDAIVKAKPASWDLSAYLFTQLAAKTIWLAASIIILLNNPTHSTITHILTACAIVSIPVIVTQFILTYSKLHPGNHSKRDNIDLMIFLTRRGKFSRWMLVLSPLIEGLSVAAMMIFYSYSLELNTLINSKKTLKAIICTCAAFAFFARYQMKHIADSREALSEINQRRDALGLPKLSPLKTIWPAALTNHLSYQLSPNLENLYHFISPHIIYNLLSQYADIENKIHLKILFLLWIGISSFGEYLCQLDDSRCFREQGIKAYSAPVVNAWHHLPRLISQPRINAPKIIAKIAQRFKNTDPTVWIYNSIRASKIAANMALTGVLPLIVCQLTSALGASIDNSAAIPLVLLGMTVGFFSGRIQCEIRDTALRNIAVYLAATLGARSTALYIPQPEQTSRPIVGLSFQADAANAAYRLA
jgi:hypothetical protein